MIRDAVSKCPHIAAAALSEEEGRVLPGAIAGALSEIARILDAADALVRREGMSRELERVFGEATLTASDELLERAADIETEIQSVERDAITSAFAGGVGEPWPPIHGARTLVDLVSQKMGEVRRLIDGCPESEESARLSRDFDQSQAALERLIDILSE
ncbi:MAG: hypothetical protein WDA27_07910 [Actinomycetota bacterium]